MGGIIIGFAYILSMGITVYLSVLISLILNKAPKTATLGWAFMPLIWLTVNSLTPPEPVKKSRDPATDPCFVAGLSNYRTVTKEFANNCAKQSLARMKWKPKYPPPWEQTEK
jgi:hypothetical protein